jgi:hypothetical protein
VLQHTPSTQLPVAHSEPLLQDCPRDLLEQTPLLQDFPPPQFIPLGALPVILQIEVPVEHEVVPVWQTFPPGLHAVPGVHALQIPFEQ